MPQLHIAIVACSAESAALCWRTNAGDLNGVADLMLSWPHKLAAAGADFLICPDNTTHQAMALVRPRSPGPWLHIDELVNSMRSAEAIQAHRRVIARMRDTGCDAVVLGCTEIPLIIDDANSPLPTLDSTRLLARAALRHAMRSG